MADLGREIGERYQHESAFVQARVRNRQLWLRDEPRTVEQDVDVDRPRAVGNTRSRPMTCSMPSATPSRPRGSRFVAPSRTWFRYQGWTDRRPEPSRRRARRAP